MLSKSQLKYTHNPHSIPLVPFDLLSTTQPRSPIQLILSTSNPTKPYSSKSYSPWVAGLITDICQEML